MDFKGSFPQNGANMPRKYNENQIKEALELLDKWGGCIGKVSSAIGVPPSALKAWAASKGKGLLPKEIAAGSRKRYYEGRTEEGRRRDTRLLFFAGFERRPAFAALSKLLSIAKLDFQP